MKLPARRIMREFSINEISAVDNPAQEGAKAVLLKRDDTTSVGGESCQLSGQKADDTSTQPTTVIKETKMTDEVTKKMEALTASLAKAQEIISMPADVRKHYDGLTAKKQDAFLAKSADERKAEAEAAIAKAADLATVVYTDANGVEYTKADDARLVTLAKNNDKLMEGIRQKEAEAKDAELAKRAAELEHIPGDEAVRVALLKSIEAIADEEVRNRAFEALKAKSDAAAPAFKPVGVAGNPVNKSDSIATLDALAKAYAAEKGVTYAKAYDAVLKTAEGAKLYAAE